MDWKIITQFLRQNLNFNSLSFYQVFPFYSKQEILTVLAENNLLTKMTTDPLSEIFQKHSNSINIGIVRSEGIISLLDSNRSGSYLKLSPEDTLEALKAVFDKDKTKIKDSTLLAYYDYWSARKNKTPGVVRRVYCTHKFDTSLKSLTYMEPLAWKKGEPNLIAPADIAAKLIPSDGAIYSRCELIPEIEYQLTFSGQINTGSFFIKVGEVLSDEIKFLPGQKISQVIQQALVKTTQFKVAVCGKDCGATKWDPGSFSSGIGIRFLDKNANIISGYCETLTVPSLTIVNNTTGITIAVNQVNSPSFRDFLDYDGNLILDDNGYTCPAPWMYRHKDYLKEKIAKWNSDFIKIWGPNPLLVGIDFEDGLGFYELKQLSYSNFFAKTSPYHTSFFQNFDFKSLDYKSLQYKDDAAQHIGAILNDLRAEYLNDTLGQIHRSGLSNTKMVNYDHRIYTKTKPLGWLSDRSIPWHSIGARVGNMVCRPLYGGAEPIETPTNPLTFGVSTASKDKKLTSNPIDRLKIKSIERKDNKLIIKLYDRNDMMAKVGSCNDQFAEDWANKFLRLDDQRSAIKDFVKNPNDMYLVLDTPLDVNGDKTNLICKSEGPDIPLKTGWPWNASTNIWANLFDPWSAFITQIARIRQMEVASISKMAVFIAARTWLLDFSDILYDELIVHALFRDAQLMFWNSDTTKTGGGPKIPNDDIRVNNIVWWFNNLVGPNLIKSHPMNFETVNRWTDKYIMSGFVNGPDKFVRLTVNPEYNPLWNRSDDNTRIFIGAEEINIPGRPIDVDFAPSNNKATFKLRFDINDVPSLFFR